MRLTSYLSVSNTNSILPVLLLCAISVNGAKMSTQSPLNSSLSDGAENHGLLLGATISTEFFTDDQNNSRPITGNESLTDNNMTANNWTATWPYFNTGCLNWLPSNHAYFQIANTFLFLSYFAPTGFYGLLYLRVTLAVGSAFLAVWGWIIICAFDTFLWNALFFLINAVHFFRLLAYFQPVEFDGQLQQVYSNMFKPLKISKRQFKKVVNCMTTQTLIQGDYIITGKQTTRKILSLLLAGRMFVVENGKVVYCLLPMQFVNSLEWFGVESDDDLPPVKIEASETCRVVNWNLLKLKSVLASDPSLQLIFDKIVGQDIFQKLILMKKKITDTSCIVADKLGSTSTSNHSELENDPLLIGKNNSYSDI